MTNTTQSANTSHSPISRIPQFTVGQADALLRPYGIDRKRNPLVFVGIRGYFGELGDTAQNDRGLYDDMLIICGADECHTYLANTDPSTSRPGSGTASETRGMAALKPGAYLAYKFDLHKDSYLALCQRAGTVTVMRDGNPPYPDTGWFGINIHKGGETATWSEGCQTLPSASWPDFIDTATALAKRYFGTAWQTTPLYYVLCEAQEARRYVSFPR